jgi:hypothetical protein
MSELDAGNTLEAYHDTLYNIQDSLQEPSGSNTI